jgi:polygalacturonase
MIDRVLLLSLLAAICACSQNILRFGAIPNDDTLHAQTANAHAISAAIAAANSSASTGDARVVVVPRGKFYSLPFTLNHCNHIVLEIQGKLSACNRIKHWPHNSNRLSYQDFIGI